MIDFTGVKAITIPEGAVAKITDSNGTVLWEKPNAGDGYTKANYIQFTGEQTIDTGIVPTQDTIIEIVFTRELAEANYLYGVRNSGNTASVTAYFNENGAWRFGNTYRNFTISTNVLHTAVVDKTGVKMDNAKYSYGASVSNFTANASLTIGSARSTAGALGSPQFVGKIYSFKMYSGDELLADYVPCVKSDGVYCFFDNVSNKFIESITETALQGA